jgi:hypothetical protein
MHQSSPGSKVRKLIVEVELDYFAAWDVCGRTHFVMMGRSYRTVALDCMAFFLPGWCHACN